jgi:hypothetical protein
MNGIGKPVGAQGEVCGFWRRWDERLTEHIPNSERLFLSLMFMYEVMQ